MGEIKKGNHIMKLFNWLRGLFRKPRTDHGDPNYWVWDDPSAPKPFSVLTEGPKYTPAIDYQTKTILPGRIYLGGSSALIDWRSREQILRTEIARLKRNKKKHSHLQKELDALIDSCADTQTNNGDDQ